LFEGLVLNIIELLRGEWRVRVGRLEVDYPGVMTVQAENPLNGTSTVGVLFHTFTDGSLFK
jgi:hypothetical protein